MTLVTNYLDFKPITVDETGQTIGGFTWWGETGGKDVYIGHRQTQLTFSWPPATSPPSPI